MAVPGPGKDVFVLKVKFRPQSACRTAVLGLPGRDRGSVRQPANRSDGPTHPNPVHPAQQGVTREWWDVIGPSLIDWIIESSPNVRTWPRLSRPSIFIVTNTRPEFNPPPGQHPRQSYLVPQNSYPTPLDSTALRSWTCSHILHTRQSKEEPPRSTSVQLSPIHRHCYSKRALPLIQQRHNYRLKHLGYAYPRHRSTDDGSGKVHRGLETAPQYRPHIFLHDRDRPRPGLPPPWLAPRGYTRSAAG